MSYLNIARSLKKHEDLKLKNACFSKKTQKLKFIVNQNYYFKKNSIKNAFAYLCKYNKSDHLEILINNYYHSYSINNDIIKNKNIYIDEYLHKITFDNNSKKCTDMLIKYNIHFIEEYNKNRNILIEKIKNNNDIFSKNDDIYLLYELIKYDIIHTCNNKCFEKCTKNITFDIMCNSEFAEKTHYFLCTQCKECFYEYGINLYCNSYLHLSKSLFYICCLYNNEKCVKVMLEKNINIYENYTDIYANIFGISPLYLLYLNNDIKNFTLLAQKIIKKNHYIIRETIQTMNNIY